MKKYVKPELFYEQYELTQHIADCDWEMKNSTDQNMCKAYGEEGSIYEGVSLFVTGLACVFTTDDGAWEDYCYHSGSDGHMKVFAS